MRAAPECISPKLTHTPHPPHTPPHPSLNQNPEWSNTWIAGNRPPLSAISSWWNKCRLRKSFCVFGKQAGWTGWERHYSWRDYGQIRLPGFPCSYIGSEWGNLPLRLGRLCGFQPLPLPLTGRTCGFWNGCLGAMQFISCSGPHFEVRRRSLGS